MSSCPACQGLPEIEPCKGYCINVMKGCLAFHSELSDSWNKFIGEFIVEIFSTSTQWAGKFKKVQAKKLREIK